MSCEGWGELSKIFSIAKEVSEKMQMEVMVELDEMMALILQAACVRANILAS